MCFVRYIYILMSSQTTSGCSRHTYGVLARVPVSELTGLRVSVRRKDITTLQPAPAPIVRDIADPRSIIPLVHIKKA
nr:male-specific transformer isoform m [Altica lythri]